MIVRLAGLRLRSEVLEALAAENPAPVGRNGEAGPSMPRWAERGSSGRIYVPAEKFDVFLEKAIELAGGVRALGRRIGVNSGALSDARSGYVAPGVVSAFGLLRHRPRWRWIADCDRELYERVEDLRVQLDLSREDILEDFVRSVSERDGAGGFNVD